MNKQELLRQLKDYLKEFGSYNFHFHPEFIRELVDIVRNISFQQTFFNQLVTVFNNLREYRYNIYQIDSHEHLKGSPLYSLHIQCKNYNIRLLTTFNEIQEPVFLLAFYERGGKRKTSYENHKPIAENRRQELLRS